MSYPFQILDTTIFGYTKKDKISIETKLELQFFIKTVITKSGFELKNSLDFNIFNKTFNPKWDLLWNRFQTQKNKNIIEWPIFCCCNIPTLTFCKENNISNFETHLFPNIYGSVNVV